MPDPIAAAKRALRAEVRERRELLSAQTLEDASHGIADQLDALVERFSVRSMSCFLSTRTEPGTGEFITRAIARGIRVLVPISREDGLLDWAVVTEGGSVGEGLFGISEPTGEVLGPIAVGEVDLMVIPAASIATDGTRLGWGRGYYDKTLGSMEHRPPVYALVHDHEVVDSLPADLHDRPVDGVVTPTTIRDLATPVATPTHGH